MAGLVTTYEDFEKKAKQYGIRFSAADRDLAQKNPAAGMRLLQAKLDYGQARTEEARALAHQQAEDIRARYGGYSGSENGWRTKQNADYKQKQARQAVLSVLPEPVTIQRGTQSAAAAATVSAPTPTSTATAKSATPVTVSARLSSAPHTAAAASTRTAANGISFPGYNGGWGGVEQAKQLVAARQAMQDASTRARKLDYIKKYGNTDPENDTFSGQFRANLTIGRMTQDRNAAWNAYLDNPTRENYAYASTLDQLIAAYRQRNAAALDDEEQVLPWISRDLARYLPQLKDQTVASLTGAAGGALTGAAAGSAIPAAGTATGALWGARAGAVAGSGAYSYQSMRGAAYADLRALGADDETARAAANDEAVISSLIEMADTGVDIATLGIGNVLKAAGKGTVKAATKTAGKKLVKALARYGLNVAGEALEEGTQQAVTIANRNRLAEGQTNSGVLDLAGRATRTFLGDATPEEQAEMIDAAGGGARIAAMMGGAATARNALAGRVLSGKQQQQTQTTPTQPQPARTQTTPAQTQTTQPEPAPTRPTPTPTQTSQPVRAQSPGIVRNDAWRNMHLSVRDNRVLETLGQALGVEIRFADHLTDSSGQAVNGSYSGSAITLSTESKDPVVGVVIHEAVHRVKDLNPDAYADMAGYVARTMGDDKLQQAVDQRAQLYRTEDMDVLLEETVADAFARSVDDKDLASQLFSENRSFGQRLVGAIRDVIAAIQRTLTGKNGKWTDYQKQIFSDLTQHLDATQNAFIAALTAADPRQGQTRTGITEQPMWSKSDRDMIDSYIAQYGQIPAGERPHRQITLPEQTGKSQRVSHTARTILEAAATPDTLVPDIEHLVANGTLSHTPYTDAQAVASAQREIETIGWTDALSRWQKAIQTGRVSKDVTTMGWVLYEQAAQSGDAATALTVLQSMVDTQRDAAQALQATRILKSLSPDTQLYGAQQSIAHLQWELSQRYGDQAPNLKIDEELARQYLAAPDQETRDRILAQIYADIGKQLPSTLADKWQAWRYLSMLGNPRTHVRNVLGNAGFVPVVAAKDLTATAIEAAVSRVSPNFGRTKGLVGPGDRALLSAAWNDYANVQDQALSGQKYDDRYLADQQIQQGRRVFSGPLEAVRKANSAALDREDIWFSRPHYTFALAQYAKANGIGAEQLQNGTNLDAARAYALKEAQKATYRDSNSFSEYISRLGRYPGRNPVGKAASGLVEGVLPFRKTPANILMRGIEYSPIGLLKAVSTDLFAVKNGKMSGAEMVDHLSAGLTGTGLMVLGAWMASQGLVRGTGSGDEKDDGFEALQGRQDYSIELGDTSVTLDWMAPESLPFFIGVNLWESVDGMDGGETGVDSVLDALSSVSDPMLELSCLQSLSDLFENIRYVQDSGQSLLPGVLAGAATSYLTQAVPTLAGQVERTGEPTRMSTYTDADGQTRSNAQYTLGRASARIPGWDYGQVPYIDAWGRTQDSGAPAARAANNFLNPAYVSTIETSEMEKELARLHRQTGESVYPSRPGKTITVTDPATGESVKKRLTSDEYVQYATTKGRLSYDLATEATGSKLYDAMDDAARAAVIGDIYAYAGYQARHELAPNGTELASWVADAEHAENAYGISTADYIMLRSITKGVTGYKDKAGNGIASSEGLQKMKAVYEAMPSVAHIPAKQREALWDALGVGKAVWSYNSRKVTQELNRLKKQAE